MRLKVLGAYGASDAEHNLTGYLIDDWFAVDAVTLTSKLSFAQQARVQAVFITHPHADHIRDLPHLIHSRFSQPTQPLTIFAAKESSIGRFHAPALATSRCLAGWPTPRRRSI